MCFGGDVLLISLGAGGLGTAFGANPLILQGVAWAGTLFLLFFAFRAFTRAARPQALTPGAAGETGESLGAAVASALAVTFLNPHVYLDTVVLLGSISTQYVGQQWLFGTGAMLASFVFFFSLGYGARLLQPVFQRVVAWRLLDLLIGVMMWAIAVSLLQS